MTDEEAVKIVNDWREKNDLEEYQLHYPSCLALVKAGYRAGLEAVSEEMDRLQAIEYDDRCNVDDWYDLKLWLESKLEEHNARIEQQLAERPIDWVLVAEVVATTLTARWGGGHVLRWSKALMGR